MRAYGFIDWSGDPGFKFAVGSSTRFALALVSTDDYDELQRALLGLKHRLGVPQGYEFHFAHNPYLVRRAFFATLSSLAWDAAVLLVDKHKLPVEFARMRAPAFCGAFLEHLLVCVPLSLVEVKYLLVDDARKESRLVRAMRLATSNALRAQGVARTPTMRGEPAHQWDGLQVADMLAGAVAELADGGEDHLKELEKHLLIHRYQAVK